MNLILLSMLFGAIQLCLSANILFLNPMPARGHYNIIEGLIRELVKKGNKVTLISPFRMPYPPEGLTELAIPDIQEKLSEVLKNKTKDETNREGKFNLRKLSPFAHLMVSMMGDSLFTATVESESVQYLLNSNETFDVVVGECFLVEGLLGGMAHRFNAPMVAIATFMPNVWPNTMVGNPAPASYIPEPLLPFTDKMSFLERVINLVYGLAAEFIYYAIHLPRQDELMRNYYGDELPPLEELIANVSLVLVNHHYGISFPRAYVPNMVEIGGLHIKPPEPLPKNLKKFMDEAKDGVIYFSMGTNLESAHFPAEHLHELIKAFSKLKQRILWKFERENLPGKPRNVMISTWVPQTDVLAHPNLKLFITHGGIMSIIEAVMRGVPIIAIPIYGDQRANVQFMLDLELGLKIEYEDIKKDTVLDAVNEILNNPKYARNMKYRSEILRDLPVSQMDSAVFWIEYVIRHKGAPHLRSTAQDLFWFQLHLIDVLGFLALAIYVIIFLFCRLLRYYKRLFCPVRRKPSHGKKKKH